MKGLRWIAVLLVTAMFWALPVSAAGGGVGIAPSDEIRAREAQERRLAGIGGFLSDYWIRRVMTGRHEPDGPVWQIGDVTLDGKINAADALMALQYGLYDSLSSSDSGFNDFFYSAYTYAEDSYIRYYQRVAAKDDRVNTDKFTIRREDVRWSVMKNNAHWLSDTSGDNRVNAVDALYILQYATGKRKAFPRTDFSCPERTAFLMWPSQWRPGMFKVPQPDWSDEIWADAYYRRGRFTPEMFPWDFYDPANWTYLPGYYEKYILPLKEANEG